MAETNFDVTEGKNMYMNQDLKWWVLKAGVMIW